MDDQSMTRDIAKDVNEAVASWNNNNPPEKIAQNVEKRLSSLLENVVADLLGFEIEYPYHSADSPVWKIKRTRDYGRYGSPVSPAEELLKSISAEAVQEWVNKEFSELPEVPEAAKEAFRQAYIETFKSQMLQQSRNLATEHAKAYSERLLKSATESPLLQLPVPPPTADEIWGFVEDNKRR